MILARITSSVTLSELLCEAKAAGSPTDVLELLTLLALHHYAPEEPAASPIRVEKVPGELLEAGGFFGDEMVICPLE